MHPDPHPQNLRNPDGMDAGRAVRRHPPRLCAGRCCSPVGQFPHPPHSGRDGCRAAVPPAAHRAVCAHAGRADRQPGHAAGASAGLKAIYLSGWQVAADANLVRRNVSGPVALSGEFGAHGGAADQRRIAPLRPDRPAWRHDQSTYWMAPIVADAEAGFGGAAERVRADARHDRGGRRRRAFRGPARQREEMRPSGRQGAGADQPAHPHPERGPARRRRGGRGHGAVLPHRRPSAPSC